MAPSSIISGQTDGETMETVTDFVFLGSNFTADSNCSHEIKRHLLLRRKVMTNLDRILKSRDITLSTNVRLVKVMVFLVVMCGLESWIIKKAEHQHWCLWTVVLEMAIESLLDCNQSPLEIQPVHPKGSQSWIFTGKTGAKAETPTWCKEVTNKRPWCWERLKAGGEGDDREWDDWMASLTQWTWVWANSRRWWRTGRPGMLQSVGSQRVGHDWATELNN